MTVLGASDNGLFSVVPAGDPTYARLEKLARAGLLPAGDVAPPLSRYDVAGLILKARDKYAQLVVAQDDMEIPPPPPEGQEETAASSPTPTPAPTAVPLTEVAKTLDSLEGAYQYELKAVKDSLQAVQKEADEVDAKQYGLRKRVVGLGEYSSLSVHGLGRAFGSWQQYTGGVPSYVLHPGNQEAFGYLDLDPEGVVSKQVSWNADLRLESFFQPGASPVITLRRASMQFNPGWISATLGDFDEAYTPLVLWNRNSLDLEYTPEMIAREDDTAKYESFFNHEPDWPFRGVKIGTALMWPDSDLLEGFQVSTFANMLRSNMSDYNSFINPAQTTDWIFGGQAALQSRKWYWQGASWQWDLRAYGVVLDQPLNTDPAAPPYDPLNAATWNHQYLIGSVKPSLKVGLGNGLTVGDSLEYAASSYQDDKRNPDRVVTDNAMIEQAYVRWGDSTLTFNYLYVDPYYYSPLAQTRQDAVTDLSNPSSLSYLDSPDLFSAPLRSQFFLPAVPRAGGIFGFYDRTQDNTFPYGLATPNREGSGLELDIRALDQKALRIRGAAYFVQEIQDNYVVNGSYTGYVPVDAAPGMTSVPLRSFTYVNVGPSFNLGPCLGLGRDVEIGANVRMEQTTGGFGTLTSTWVIGGVKADILPVWEISAAFSDQQADGTEEGYNGTLWARYSYLFDSSDLGQYSAIHVDGSNQSWRFSNLFKVNTNSTIYLDFDWTHGNLMPISPTNAALDNQFYEVTYEVKF